MIRPHGGRLVNRLATGEKAVALEAEAARLPAVKLDASSVFLQDLGFTTPTQGAAIVGVQDGTHVIGQLLMTTDGGHHWHTANLGP